MLNVLGITKKYSKNDPSCFSYKNISLSLKKGEVVSLVGPSGSGKSSLLRSIAGLDEPDSGLVELGADKTSVYVSQENVLFPHLNVIQNIMLVPGIMAHSSKELIEKRALAFLEKFGLTDKLGSFVGELSGGEKQRVSLIMALMIEPDILLLDEISSALDPELSFDVLSMVSFLATQGYTILLASHHIPFIRKISDRVIFIEQGSILIDEKTETFFSTKNPRVKNFLNILS